MLHFYINYATYYGQEIIIQFENDLPDFVLSIAPDRHTWHGILPDDWLSRTLKTLKTQPIRYKYALRDTNFGDATTDEWGKWRTLVLPKGAKGDTVVRDYWRSSDRPENPTFTSAFYNAVWRQAAYKAAALPISEWNVRFQINAPRVEAGQRLAVLIDEDGTGKLGNHRLVPLCNDNYPTWSTEVKLNSNESVRYKYALVRADNLSILMTETGEERWLAADAFSNEKKHIVTDEVFRHPAGNWRGAGVAVPVFSLRSEAGMGVGEFNDLKLLADWSEQTGLKMIQVLPINDTTSTHTWTDSYPYAAITIYALHPMHLNIASIGAFPSPEAAADYEAVCKTLNASDTVDYEGVMANKWRFSKVMYGYHGTAHFKTATYKTFFEANKKWLVPYSVFSYLRDENGTADYANWGEHAVYDSEKIESELLKPRSKSLKAIQLYYFMQYHLHLQLLAACDYAREKGILLKGDIPIGIFRYSVDAWTEPRYFNLDGQAGAPPDSYSATGQNWGLPTYDWHEMQQDDFAWWRSRLQHSAQYFEAFRIDHVLGFFRIWEIPTQHTYGMMGRFNPAWGINRNDFAARGISFNTERFCEPYIRDYLFDTFFGTEAEYIKNHYFDQYETGKFRFRETVNTQRKVENVFEINDTMHPDEQAWKKRIKQAMLELHAEILLFEAPFSNGEAYHPRIELYKTHSFRDLNDHEKHELAALHNDYFYGKQEPLWKEQAEIRLPAVTTATDMLICGEDLGMVPQSVPQVMRDLQMLSLEIQRMPKGYGKEFGNPAEYPYWSVCSPSCHDMSTIRGWWEEDRTRSERFYRSIMGSDGELPYYCEDWVVKAINAQHLYSPSMWAVFPLQDFLGMDARLRRADAVAEQINNPGNSKHYWRFRFHLPIEQLLAESQLNVMVKEMVKSSGR
ncbi:MAG: hypothetical protein RI894_1160 [Bacteroidota bacterium]|jgi:4-alpha-glucanotransferase